MDYKAKFQEILTASASANWTNRETGATMALAEHGAEFLALIADGERYRHRRFIEVTNDLAMSGVMAISPELLKGVLDEYDLETEALRPMEIDFD